MRHALLRRRHLIAGACVCAVSAAVAIVWPFSTPATYAFPADALAQPYATPGAAVNVHTDATPRARPRPTPVPTCPHPTVKTAPWLPATWPVALEIPSLHVIALVEKAGRDHQGNMQVPSRPCDVAWYAAGVTPGHPGDAVFDGHLDWYGAASVFADLSRVRPGAEIDVISARGVRLRFAVRTLRYVPYQSRPAWLFATSGAPTISLYTCAGWWEPWRSTYSDRLVVTASLLPG